MTKCILEHDEILSRPDILTKIFEYFNVNPRRKKKFIELLPTDIGVVKYILKKSRKIRIALNLAHAPVFDIMYIAPCLLAPNFFILRINEYSPKIVQKIKSEYPDLKLKYQYRKYHNNREYNLSHLADYIDFDGKFCYFADELSRDIIKIHRHIFLENKYDDVGINPVLYMERWRNVIINKKIHRLYISHSDNVKFENPELIDHVVLRNCRNIEFKNVKNYQSETRASNEKDYSKNIKIDNCRTANIENTDGMIINNCNVAYIQFAVNIKIIKLNRLQLRREIGKFERNIELNGLKNRIAAPIVHIHIPTNVNLNNNIIKTLCLTKAWTDKDIANINIENCKNLKIIYARNKNLTIKKCPNLNKICYGENCKIDCDSDVKMEELTEYPDSMLFYALKTKSRFRF